MKKAIDETTTIEELGEIVAATLKEANIDVVLSGGAVVSIYSRNRYESGDLDFITHATIKSIAPVMDMLGFRLKDRSFVHPTCRFFVEFPPAPVEIGRLPVPEEGISVIRSLRLLSPTYCVMDRLAQYIHWKDRQGLEQAILVASEHPIKFTVVETWLKNEGHPEAFAIFMAGLNKHGRKKSANDEGPE